VGLQGQLADAQPDDDTAFQCCLWICDRAGNVGTWDKRMYDADQKAWQILAAHHTGRTNLPMLCLKAVQYEGPAREKFLRDLLARKDLSHENIGFATLALAEKLAHLYGIYRDKKPAELPAVRDEYVEDLLQQRSPNFEKYLQLTDAAKTKAESIQLFKVVLTQYADVPVTISAPYFRSLTTLGEKATKSLHGLEHLDIGATAPSIVGTDLNGQPLDLRDFRGKVVVLSFWFTGCGPCMQMVPQEQRLVETYQGRPFALLGICTDDSTETAKKTATEHKMNWSCWFDGQTGPIARDFNILKWPTIYVIDKDGTIAALDLGGDKLDAKIAELLNDK
jgi:peroxiredoxin